MHHYIITHLGLHECGCIFPRRKFGKYYTCRCNAQPYCPPGMSNDVMSNDVMSNDVMSNDVKSGRKIRSVQRPSKRSHSSAVTILVRTCTDTSLLKDRETPLVVKQREGHSDRP